MSLDAADAIRAADEARDAWYLAASAAEQGRALAALAALGGRAHTEQRRAAGRAVTHLIELANFTLHPRERVPVLQALGRCTDQAFAVPVLVATLEHDDPSVVSAALDAIGHVGVPFGGSWIQRWLVRPRSQPLPDSVLERALLAMARTGHPEAGPMSLTAWEGGTIGAEALHLALAEAVSPLGWELAREHLRDPAACRASAMHLATSRHPELPRLLLPFLNGYDAELALLCHALLEGSMEEVGERFLEAASEDHPLRRRRLGRSLRGWSEDEVLEAWEALVGPQEDVMLLDVAMVAGIPALQDAAVAWAECGSPCLLTQALRRLRLPTPRLLERLPDWLHHDDDDVVAAAVREHLNLFGVERVGELRGLLRSSREVHRVEWVRVWQNGWMARRGADGRTPLDHQSRQDLVRSLRTLVREDSSFAVRMIATYCAGNLGLGELGDELLRVLASDADDRERRAAAIALAEIGPRDGLGVLLGMLAEEREPLLFHRLVRAVLAAVEASGSAQVEVAAVAARRLEDADAVSRPPLLALLGRCGCEQAREPLVRMAGSEVHRQACVALSALGRLGDDRALSVILPSSEHQDPERRLRAVQALGGIPGSVAADRLATILCDGHEELDIRVVALHALGERVAEIPEDALNPPEHGDPLAASVFELLREVGGARSGLDSEALDARLAAAVPGLRLSTLSREHRGALQALRTAEFLHAGVELPRGLDAAPPVLFWVKGLEQWLNGVLAARLQALATPQLRPSMKALVDRWSGLRTRLAPRWDDQLIPGPSGRLWRNLAKHTEEQVRYGVGRSQLGSRQLATFLLACAEPPLDCGLGRWRFAAPRVEVEDLANGLVCLAHKRNPLAHGTAGDGTLNEPVRALALDCARVIAKLG